jgi:nucleoside-diphosphate-sugar epimerase
LRVVLVGGTGNISAGIVKALLRLGHEVAVFNRGRRANCLSPGVRVIIGDREQHEQFERQMQQEHFDAAIDMVCYTPEEAASTLRAFRGVKHLIYCSTVCVYGVPLPRLPASEETPLCPITAYGRNKGRAEAVFLAAYQRGEVAVTIFRPAYIYSQQWVVLRQLGFDPNWLDRLRKGKPLLIAGDGQGLWSFCHGDDAGVAFAAAVGRAACFGQVYNLAYPEILTWQEYHERVAAALGVSAHLVSLPAETILASPLEERAWMLATQTRWSQFYTITRLLQDIPEFSPQITLENGIRACIAELDRHGIIGNSDNDDAEDRLIALQKPMLAEIRLWTQAPTAPVRWDPRGRPA